MKITGACHCGDITYEAELDPARFGICHCTDCQVTSASAFRTIAVVKQAEFRLLSGTPKTYIKQAESGNRRALTFCSTCGAGLWATDEKGESGLVNLRAGTITERRELDIAAGPQATLDWVIEAAQRLLADLDVDPSTVLGVGIGVGAAPSSW